MNARVWFAVISAVCGIAVPLRAQAPAANSHHFVLSATVSATGGAAKSKGNVKVDPGGKPLGGNWVTAEQQHFKNTRESDQAVDLDVEIRNLSRTPDTAKLEWFFYSRSLTGGEAHIFDSGTQDVPIDGTASSKVELQSKDVTSKVEKKLYITDGVDRAGNSIAPQSSVKKTGEKIVGWAVRISDQGKVLEVRASSPTYETMGRTAVLPPPESESKKKR